MTAIVLKYARKTGWWILTVLISILVVTGVYYVSRRVMKSITASKPDQPQIEAKFAVNDTVQFSPVSGKVFDTPSDMTVNAILAGGFGPAIVMIYADWCVHCRNMMPAYESAAAAAASLGVPLIRIQGAAAPVTCQKHKVLGFPTILGVTHDGNIQRFAEARTSEKLVSFASSLKSGASIPDQVLVVPSVPSAQLAPVPAVPMVPTVPTVPTVSEVGAQQMQIPAGLTEEVLDIETNQMITIPVLPE